MPLLLLLLSVVVSIGSQAAELSHEPGTWKTNGSARVRTEAKGNSDFNNSNADYMSSTASRFRLGLTYTANDKVEVFLQPQFTKIWGDTEYAPSSPTANTATNTSGATNDTGLDIHQAVMSYAITPELKLSLGRKELNYGDQLLVGPVGWNNFGRSFDLIHARQLWAGGWVDLFNSKIVEHNAAASGPGDKDFSGLVFNYGGHESVPVVEAYSFYLKDGAAVTESSTLAYGLRVKGTASALDYRAEATAEKVKAAGDTKNEAQYNAEVGWTFLPSQKTRVAAEYFDASQNFDQLFPTGHKWLGYADLFSRRNISGYRLGVSSDFGDMYYASLDFHVFEKHKAADPAYKFAGTAYAGTSEARSIAKEFDLVVGMKPAAELSVEIGYSKVMPDAYLKETLGGDAATFIYLQVNQNF